MKSTTDLSRLSAERRPPSLRGGVRSIDPELLARADALESTFDRGATAYLEDVLPELEELQQLLERQLRAVVADRSVVDEGPATSPGGSCVQPDDRQPPLCREFARLVDEARSRCLGVPNPPAFRWVADRFSLLRNALES